MELGTYVGDALVAIACGIARADEGLRGAGLGSVWRGDFATPGKDLVHLRIAKGDGGSGRDAVPVLVVEFEVHVQVESSSSMVGTSGADVATRIPHLISVTVRGQVEGDSSAKDVEFQRLAFAVPLALEPLKARETVR